MSTQAVMYIDQNCLIVPIKDELNSQALDQLQAKILSEIRESRLHGVVIDLSGTRILDSYQAQHLFSTAKMVKLLGASAVICGLRAGIVVSLIDLGFEIGHVKMANNLEAGKKMIIDAFQSNIADNTC